MGYVNIPKDLTKIDRKVMLNLTKRQLSLFIPAIILGIGAYLLTYKKIGTNAMYLTVAIIVPFFYAALYKNRDNERIEDIILKDFFYLYDNENNKISLNEALTKCFPKAHEKLKKYIKEKYGVESYTKIKKCKIIYKKNKHLNN